MRFARPARPGQADGRVARPRGTRAHASSRLGSIRCGAPAVALRERLSTTPTVSLTRSRRPRRLPDRARVAPMRFPLETSSVEALGFDAKPLRRLRELITAHIAEGRYPAGQIAIARDRKSTRLNSSHGYISYAVFCLKKKKNKHINTSYE